MGPEYEKQEIKLDTVDITIARDPDTTGEVIDPKKIAVKTSPDGRTFTAEVEIQGFKATGEAKADPNYTNLDAAGYAVSDALTKLEENIPGHGWFVAE